jgi:phenylacetate-CoA ligase
VRRVIFTSGFTGKPKVACYSADDIARYETESTRARLVLEDLPIKCVASLLPYEISGLGIFMGTTIEKGLRSIHVPIGLKADPQWVIKLLMELGSNVVITLPSVAARLTEVARTTSKDLADIGIRKMLLLGEPVSQSFRSWLENNWATDVFCLYGMTEFMALGYECREKNGFHLYTDRFSFEITPPSEHTASSYGLGELLITPLTKTAMPLLRYRTHDAGNLITTRCHCGSDYPRLLLKGRLDDAVLLSGAKMFPVEMENAILSVEGVLRNYEILLEDDHEKDRMVIRIEIPKKSDSVSIKERIVEALLRSSVALSEVYSEGALSILVQPLQEGELSQHISGKRKIVRDMRTPRDR